MLLLLLLALCGLSAGVRYTRNGPTLSDPRNIHTHHQTEFYHASVKGVNWNYVKGAVWPKPQKETRGREYFTLDPRNFYIENVGEQSDVLMQAMTRYKSLTFPDKDITKDHTMTQLMGLNVKVLEPYKAMELKTDESYTLKVGAPESYLEANTVWGALRGLESFSQIVHQNVTGFYHVQENTIVDFPRFQHRGFMIDTSRHFVNIKFILQFIDALAYCKFNILHWHVTDNQAFPFVSKTFPSLHERGSRDPVKSVYTPADVQRIIEYGRMRGVRILAEFDTPGHSASWYSIPNLLTPCYSGGKPNGAHGPINPTIEANYDFLRKFFEEVGHVFPDQYLHMGGDEVYFGCWASNPQILKWMKEHGMGKDFAKLEAYYIQRLLDIIQDLGKKYVVWEEVVTNGVKVHPDTVVNVWRGGWSHNWQPNIEAVIKKGYKVILSSCWYFNYINYGDDWKGFFECEPTNFNGTKEEKDRVIGGTAAIWGEWVDGVNLISRAWARGMTAGGRLWSSKDTTNAYDSEIRMWEHRCRYLRRGINADPLYKAQYCRHEWNNESKE